MTFQRSSLGLLAFGCALLSTAPSVAHAATTDCMNPDGTCEVSNDGGMDFVNCMCSDGSGVGGGGGMEWVGLSEMELQPICEEQLAMFCGPPPPPTGVPCDSPAGSCVVDNDPFDWVECECADGSAGGGGGGMAWAGLDDMALFGICEMELDAFCGGAPPPMGIPCGTANGTCEINNEPFDWIECECADGSLFGDGGGNMWAGLSEMELVTICEETVDLECGEPPPPPAFECVSRLGECVISNDPIDNVSCECADGTEYAGGGGMEWSELSEEELLAICESELELGCGVGETDGMTSTGTDGDTEGETEGETDPGTTTDEPPAETGEAETGSGGAEAGETGGETDGSHSTTGEPPTGGTGGTGGTDDAGAGDDGAAGGCSVGSRPGTGGWGLMLLGLLGLGWRRRRSA